MPASRTSTTASRSDGFATSRVVPAVVAGSPASRSVRLGRSVPLSHSWPWGADGRGEYRSSTEATTRPRLVLTLSASSSVCGAISDSATRLTLCGARVMPSVATVSTGPSGPRTWRSRTAGPGSTLASTRVEEWSRPAPAPVNHHWDRGAGQGATARARPRWLSVRKPNSPAAAPPVASTAGPPSGRTSTTEPAGYVDRAAVGGHRPLGHRPAAGRLHVRRGGGQAQPDRGGGAPGGRGVGAGEGGVVHERTGARRTHRRGAGRAGQRRSGLRRRGRAAPARAGTDGRAGHAQRGARAALGDAAAGARLAGLGVHRTTFRVGAASTATTHDGDPLEHQQPGPQRVAVADEGRAGRSSPRPATRGRPAGWRCRS